ncbi:MAG: O-antigen ligase family protein, partial [Clostridia bacterium]|nr:O-antigen ligase family protein [Clostridia bacterium]
MRRLKTTDWRQRYFTGLHAVFVLLAVFSQLFFLVSPTHAQPVSAAYLWPAAVALLALILYRNRTPRPVGMSILLALSAWTYGTCLLNGDYYLIYHIGFMLGVVLAFGVCYPLFLLMDDNQRALWLRRFAHAVVCSLALTAWLGVYAAVTGTPIVTPLSNEGLGLYTWERRLYLFGQHPNSNACIFSVALFLTLFLMARARSWKKILYAPACIGLYAAIALTLSRTVMITVGIGFAMLTLLLIVRHAAVLKPALRIGAYIAAPLAVAVAVFLCFSPVYRGILSVSDSMSDAGTGLASAEVKNSQAAAALPKPEPVQQSSGEILERTFSNDIGTLRGRTDIWKIGIDQIKQRPITLLIGMLDSKVARLPLVLGRGPE